MKPLKAFLLPVLAFALGAAVVRVWRLQQEIETLKRTSSEGRAATAQHAQASEAAEKHLREVSDENAALRTQLAALREEKAASATKPAAAKSTGDAAETSPENSDAMAQWLADASDPAVLRRLNLQARNRVVQRYGELFKQLNLPPDQTEQLTKLLTDKRQSAMDVAVTSYQNGDDPAKNPDEYHDRLKAAREDIENQISALLGENGFAQYQDYDRSRGQLNVLNNLQVALQATKEPLTPEQTTRLTEVLQDSNTTKVTAKLIKDSRSFLSPIQVQAMEDLRAVQQANSQKRNQPMPALPNAPVTPAPKPKS